jgi:glucosamine-6-phosphate deaminase
VNLITTSSPEEFALRAAAVVADEVAGNPTLSLTLPTGSTPLGLYARLRDEHRAQRFSLDRANVFMLDEYVDLATYPDGSFLATLQFHLGEMVFNDTTTVHPLLPDADQGFLARYDATLDAAAGLDLAIVGVGRNGHVGFNEPGARDDERTHFVTLAPDTLDANFPDVASDERPTRAVTMGLADLLGARSVLLLVNGASKHDVARLLLTETYVDSVPVTHLLGHPRLTVVMDERLLVAPERGVDRVGGRR